MGLVRDRDGLESRVGSERAEQVADVVVHGLRTELELVGDLPRRASALEEDFRLTRSQVELGMFVGLLDDARDLPEDADHVITSRSQPTPITRNSHQ
jgi:hypothetical protein